MNATFANNRALATTATDKSRDISVNNSSAEETLNCWKLNVDGLVKENETYLTAFKNRCSIMDSCRFLSANSTGWEVSLSDATVLLGKNRRSSALLESISLPLPLLWSFWRQHFIGNWSFRSGIIHDMVLIILVEQKLIDQ